jgi:PAS domain S-box-containing protein
MDTKIREGVKFLPPAGHKSPFEEFILKSVEAFLFCDTEGKIVVWNRGCQYLFGYSQAEAREYSLLSLFTAGSFNSFSSMFEAVKKDRVVCVETHCVNKHGKVFEAEIVGGMLKSGDKPLAYFMFRDISRLGRYRDKLNALSMFPENTSDFIMEWEKEQGITYCNEAVKKFLARSGNGSGSAKPEAILPKNFTDHMERLAGTDRTLREVEACHDGRTFSYSFIPYNTDEDRILIMGRDITDSHKLTEEVELSYDRTRGILDLMEGIQREIRFMDIEKEEDLKPIVNLLLRNSSDAVSRNPSHVFVARENDDGLMEGQIYVKSLGEVQPISRTITLHPVDLKGLLADRKGMNWANWQELSHDPTELLSRIPDPLKEHVPHIDNFVACQIDSEPGGVVAAFNYNGIVNKYDLESLRGLALAAGSLYSSRRQFQQKEEGFFTLVTKMAQLVEERDRETGEHLRRISSYSSIIADQLSKLPKYKDVIDREFIKKLHKSAPLHDLGKSGVPDAVLRKPGKLDDKEYEMMQKHTIIGGKLLEGPDFLSTAREIAYYHHEKYDGSGYPYGLRGEEIPLSARIVAIADVYDAMTSNRVYKEAFSHERTKKLISICSGGHFDPDVVEAFLAREQDFVRIKEMYRS